MIAAIEQFVAPQSQPDPGVSSSWDQDPTQPVARADSYGQQQAPDYQQQPSQMPPTGGMRNDRPPAATPHYGLPVSVTVPPGTFVTVRMEQELSSDHNQQGDIFSATLAQPLVVDGVVVAQRGQTVMGRVAEAMKAGRAQGTSRLALQLTGITLADGLQANIQSQLVNRNGQTSVGNDVAAVGTTTAVGAAIGAAADWGRGAAIGAGAGAAAGLVGVLLTRGRATVVYPETVLTFRIDTPLNVDLALRRHSAMWARTSMIARCRLPWRAGRLPRAWRLIRTTRRIRITAAGATLTGTVLESVSESASTAAGTVTTVATGNPIRPKTVSSRRPGSRCLAFWCVKVPALCDRAKVGARPFNGG